MLEARDFVQFTSRDAADEALGLLILFDCLALFTKLAEGVQNDTEDEVEEENDEDDEEEEVVHLAEVPMIAVGFDVHGWDRKVAETTATLEAGDECRGEALDERIAVAAHAEIALVRVHFGKIPVPHDGENVPAHQEEHEGEEQTHAVLGHGEDDVVELLELPADLEQLNAVEVRGAVVAEDGEDEEEAVLVHGRAREEEFRVEEQDHPLLQIFLGVFLHIRWDDGE